MKKENITRGLALGALMAFVITGSALAENITVNVNGVKEDMPKIEVQAGETFQNAGTVNASESVTVNGGIFKNTGTINTTVLDVYGNTNDKNPIAGIINASEKFVYRGIAGNLYPRGLSATLNTPLLHIIGISHPTGFLVSDNTVLENVDSVIIEKCGTRTGLQFKGNGLEVKSVIILAGSGGQDARIEVNDGSDVTVDTIINTAPDKGVIQTDGNSKISVNNIDVAAGTYLALLTYGKDSDEGEFTLNTVSVGEDAKLRVGVYDPNPSAKINGDITINLAKDALVDFGGMKNDNWYADRVNVAANSLTVNVADSRSDAMVYVSAVSDIAKTPEKINVIAAGVNNTGDAEKDLQAVSEVIAFTKDTKNPVGEKPEILTAVGANVVQAASDIYDSASAVIGDDGNVKNITINKNINVFGVKDIAANALMTWRQENDDMNKRLGELRDSKGEHGVWVRMIRGEGTYESIKNQYNTYQIGYDEKLSVDPSWTLGAAFSYTDGESSFANGTGTNKHSGFAIYGSKLNEDGSFIDLIAKYARLDNEFDVAGRLFSGDYKTNGYSVSAEYGKRFTQNSGLWIEPQVQLTYGKVSAASYLTKGGIDVRQDDMDSLVGRVGVSVGKNLKQGNVYARASYLYDFDGDTHMDFINARGQKRNLECDLGGGWWEVGVGANLNMSAASHLYFDVEKTYGGDVATPWQWNLGVRWSF